jgi:hypothetical protein
VSACGLTVTPNSVFCRSIPTGFLHSQAYRQ